MRKRNIIVILITATTLITITAKASTPLFKDWGAKLNEYASSSNIKKESEIYAKGKHAVVTKEDIQQAADFYMLTGMDKASAKSEAERYMLEREAMFQKAINGGYSVSDQEVLEFLEELKQSIDQADNKSDVHAVISEFDSEEAYWDYEFTVYKKNLPIQNYVTDLEKSYFQEYSQTDDTLPTEESWLSYFEGFKKKVSDDENYKIIE